jgi:hypothetical protein
MASLSTARLWFVGLVLATLWPVNAARAQERPKAIVSASYVGVVDASLAEGGMRRETAGNGWGADIAVPLGRRIALVASIDASYGQEETTLSPLVFGGGTMTNSWTDMAYLTGVRFPFGRGGRIAPFFQTLAGLMTTRQKDEYQTVRPSGGPYDNRENFFVVVPGGGVDVALHGRFGVRAAFDVPIHMLAMLEGGDDNTLSRVTAGLVIRLP